MLKKVLCPILFCLLVITNPAIQANTTQQIGPHVNKLLSKYPNLSYGIMVYSLDQNKTLYQKNPDQLLMPASTMKILPAVAALSFLGPDYKFQTEILAGTKNIVNGTIDGDLYFYFDGDPTLTSENVSTLINNLSKLGIKKINGNIYIDDTIFDDSFFATGLVQDDMKYCFAAPISGTMIDKNCIHFKLEDAQIPDNQIKVTTNNNEGGVTLTNNLISKNPDDIYYPEIDTAIDENTALKHTATDAINTASCTVKTQISDNNNYQLSGYLQTDSLPKTISRALSNPHLYAKTLISKQLLENNIQLDGSIGFRKSPANIKLKLLAEHKSEPLSEIIKTLLKESDNTIADTIFKKLGASFFNKQASWEDGSKAIEQILAPITNIDFKKLFMDDGSGISRYDIVTPEQLMKVLKYAYEDEKIKPHFIAALANAGTDGTLEKRMPKLKNRVHAKTGAMLNATSLAGYVETKTQGTVAFVIIINSFLEPPESFNKMQDEFCNILAKS